MYRVNVGVQFVLSLSAIFATFALSNQLKYWNTTEALGKNVENVYDLRPDIYSAAKYDMFKDSLFLILDSAGNLPCVEKACLYTSYGGTLPIIYKRKYVGTNIYYVTEDVFDIFQMKLLEGKFISDSDTDKVVISKELNVLEKIGIGDTLDFNGSKKIVAGIIKDVYDYPNIKSSNIKSSPYIFVSAYSGRYIRQVLRIQVK